MNKVTNNQLNTVKSDKMELLTLLGQVKSAREDQIRTNEKHMNNLKMAQNRIEELLKECDEYEKKNKH